MLIHTSRKFWALSSAIALSIILPIAPGSAQKIDEFYDGPMTRIIGGTEATPGEYPWMAQIVDTWDPDNPEHLCGGMLIHPRYVLTAAHCVEDLEPWQFAVLLGRHRLSEPIFDRFEVIDIIIHPDWDTENTDSDIALLVLDAPANGYETLPLVFEGSNLDSVGVIGTTMGWGTTSAEQYAISDELRKLDVPILANSTANATTSYNGIIRDTMIPAGFMKGGKDSCQGDSGGPLIVPNGKGGYALAGIASFGYGCADPGFPGIYTRVSKFRDWVLSYILPNYHDWETRKGVKGETLDFDGDNISNFEEYAFGTEPTDPSSHPINDFGLRMINSKQHFWIQYATRARDEEILYTPSVSSDLETWTPIDVTTSAITPTESPTTELTPIAVRSELSTSDANEMFMTVEANVSSNFVPSIYEITNTSYIRSALHSEDAMNELRIGHFKKDYLITGLTSGDAYQIAVYSYEFDPLLQLVNPATNTQISSDNERGALTDFIPSFVPSSGVNYVVRVTSASPGETGRFSLAIAKNLIFPDQTQSGVLTIDDERDPTRLPDISFKDDYLLVPPHNGVYIKINLSADFDTLLEVYDPRNGALLDSNDNISDTNTNSSLGFFLYGGYAPMIRVSSKQTGATGNYTLELDW